MTQSNLHKTLLIILAGIIIVPVPAFAFLSGVLYTLVVQTLGLFVGLAGGLLDFAINNFVIGFGAQYQTSGVGVAVDTTWVVIRDFINMSFIFGLVYIGMKMILNSDSSNTRRWLVNLLIAALLINFSLFFTKFVVDVSNQFATSIATAGFQQRTGGGVDVSAALMDKFGVSTIFSKTSNPEANPDSPSFGYIFGTALVLIIATFVFAAGAILLIIRFAVLNLFLVFSPVLFLSFILPPLQSISNSYWKKFLGKAFFAPLYLLFIYVSFSILDAMSRSGAIQEINLGGVMNQAGGGRAILQNSGDQSFAFFIFAAVLLIGSLVVANKLGAEGAGKAISLGKSLSQKAQRGTTRFAANSGKFAATQTAGRAGRRISTITGSRIDSALSRAQRSNNTLIRGAARSNLAQRSIGGAAQSMQNSQFGLSRSLNEQRKENQKLSNQTNTNADREIQIRENQNIPRIDTTSDAAAITARQDARNRQHNEIRQMSNQDIIDRAQANREEIMSPEMASLLSDAQVTALRESGVLSNAEMDTLETHKEEGTFNEINATLENSNATTENLTAAMESLNRIMSTMSNERLTNMVDTNPAMLTNQNVASRLSSAQVDTLRQSGRLTTTQMTNVTDARNAGFTTIATNGSLANPTSVGGADAGFMDRQRRGMFRNAQDAGKLPASVLSAADSAQYITPKIIEEFLSNNPNPTDLENVRRNISLHILRDPTAANTWKTWTRTKVDGRRFGLIIP